MKKLLLITLFLTQSLFAIVSIVPIEIGENVGLHSKIGLSLQTQRGNTDKDNYKGSAKVTYDSNTTYVTSLEFSAAYGETNNKEDTNKAYVHFRYVYALSEKALRAELFLQTQEDKFKAIEYRRLLGLGLRLKLGKFIKNGSGYIGVGAFYENIHYLEDTNNNKNIVLNNYLAYSIKFSKETTLAYRLDFQPIYNEFKDYILIQKLRLNVKLYENLSLQVTMIHDVDSNPAEGIDKNDFTQTTGFIYSF